MYEAAAPSLLELHNCEAQRAVSQHVRYRAAL
jgi:hypothetical protein